MYVGGGMTIRLPYSIDQNWKKGFSEETEKIIGKNNEYAKKMYISAGGGNINVCLMRNSTILSCISCSNHMVKCNRDQGCRAITHGFPMCFCATQVKPIYVWKFIMLRNVM